MSKKNEIIVLDNLDAKNLPELQGLKDVQLKLVQENPFIEIIDNKTYEEAKKRRTSLLKGRTSLESQEKIIASKLTAFRKQVASVTKELIDISLPHEEKQQDEVKRYEQIKENERLERERLENERIEKIKLLISNFESSCYEFISKCTFENVNDIKSNLDKLFNSNYDVQEFDILLEQAKRRIQCLFDEKCTDIQEKENQRKENERLIREKQEADEKLRIIQEQQEKERLEREQKEREEKEKVFEVRKNRLAEIGLEYNGLEFTIDHKKTGLFSTFELLGATVFECDIIDFENLLNDAKNSIQEAKENYEKLQAEKEAREKSEIEAKKKEESENKARVKRLSKDKAIYTKVLNDELGRFPIVFDADQEEIKNFSIKASNEVTDLLNKLLTELQNL